MSKRKLSLSLLTAILAVSALAAGSASAATANQGFKMGQGGQPTGGPRQMMAGQGEFRKPAIVGTISSLSGTIIALAGKTGFSQEAQDVTYTVDAANAKITKGFGQNAQTLSVSDLKAGDTINVAGTVSGTSVIAESISIFDKSGTPPAEGEANGLRQRQGTGADNANRPAPEETGNGFGYGRQRQNENGGVGIGNGNDNDNGNAKQKKSGSDKQGQNANAKKNAVGAEESAAPANFWSKVFVPFKNFFGKIFKFGKQK